MKTTLKILSFVVIFVAVAAASVYLGFNYVNKRYNLEKPISDTDPDTTADKNDSQEIEIEIAPNKEVRITEKTKLVYEYLYKDDAKIDKTEEDAPYFLINKTQQEIKDLYNDWDLLKFTENEVVLRKTVEGMSRQYYYIGVLDGYVAVFYKNAINGSNLKEITSTPYSTLPIEEQYKIQKGIEVTGEDNLIRLLEDYDSWFLAVAKLSVLI